MADHKPAIAFFGATGGCTLAALVPALKADYDCTALVRTPSKLTSLLAERGVPETAISSHLTITQGDVFNASDCRKSLVLNNRTVDIIITGIGTTPGGKAEITVCTTAANNILSVLPTLPAPPIRKDNQKEKEKSKEKPTQPLIIALSTTGISAGPRDIPLLMAPIYHWLLANPHNDKKKMEKAIVEQTDRFVIVRPSLLTNGKAMGVERVRTGTEGRPAVGWVVSREEVGRWMFEELVRGEGGRWVGEKVTVTR